MSKFSFRPDIWARKALVKCRKGASRVFKPKITAIAEEEEQNSGYVLGVGGATSSKKFKK